MIQDLQNNNKHVGGIKLFYLVVCSIVCVLVCVLVSYSRSPSITRLVRYIMPFRERKEQSIIGQSEFRVKKFHRAAAYQRYLQYSSTGTSTS